jgi:uncharacterized protein (DUF486 family)
MTASALWPWLALAGLGLFHGINPAMGWLFAVALGLHRRSAAAVLYALPPIALGHAAAIAVAVAIVAFARWAIDVTLLQLAAAACLIGFGVYHLVRGHRHKLRFGMQVGFLDLTLWSFLMATAHGAALMVMPVLLEMPVAASTHGAHDAVLSAFAGSIWIGLLAVAVHTAAMLLAAGVIAWVIFACVGLMVLRRAWINFDLLWSAALIATGAIFLLLAGTDLAARGHAHHAELGMRS